MANQGLTSMLAVATLLLAAVVTFPAGHYMVPTFYYIYLLVILVVQV
jgi:hypothetical protein